ncbi:MAG: PAS domain S-box protein [Desulfobacteraceae bacterium]
MTRSEIKIRHRMVTKLIVTTGLVLLMAMLIWANYNIDYQKRKQMENIVAGTDRLTNTIRLGTQYAMMLNSRDDITQIIANIGRQEEIENIRIYNKAGEIKFSNRTDEVDRITNIEAEACYICHREDPPLTAITLDERIRIFRSAEGYRLLGIITPICNDPGCSTDNCHFHPTDKEILGALDVVVSLKTIDDDIRTAGKWISALTVCVFALTSAIIFVFVLRFVNQPVKKLIAGTRRIAKGDLRNPVDLQRKDEMGHLAKAINQMSSDISQQRAELNKQRDQYHDLFQRVPCLITVQDRNYRLLNYNNEFAERFAPQPGDHCYHAYKGRNRKCDLCPVEKTYADGLSHYGEERGINKDGTLSHWIVRTSPIYDDQGEIVACMEISLDITERKQLEVELEKSEKKYHAIFNNIPNPVFVLEPENLIILDCNQSVEAVYGQRAEVLIGQSFLNLFPEEEREHYAQLLAKIPVLKQVRHLHHDGGVLFVNIRISPSAQYSGKRVLLVTTSDITKWLEAEQQLIQASKMATLGEMSTGVAHELNQPLSVIKTTSSFFLRKLGKGEPIAKEMLTNMLTKLDRNVDRAARIIHHMRLFARKSDTEFHKVQINDVLLSAFEIFDQQLKVRGIGVQWRLAEQLPKIKADPQRLEQVFINLLLNARDAIEEKWQMQGHSKQPDTISIATYCEQRHTICRICDTGPGIPKGKADKIFEPFFTTKEVGKGTGLGLSISYGIVKECGGHITAGAHNSGGACFTLKFAAIE